MSLIPLFINSINSQQRKDCSRKNKIILSFIVNLLDDFGLKAKIIIGSTREVLNIIEWLLSGAHIVTVIPSFIEGMIVHPYSKETVQMFLNDAKKVEEMLKA
ncbi:MAG: Transaldolase [candidate division WS2 bacterium]|nr:Transaldolase [Candidatus Lithacetigena glycinireducens]